MDYPAARRNMVEGQIRANKVTDPLVVEAMETIPRELFVPKHMRGIAYIDDDLEIGNGRYMMEPMILARLLQAAEVEETDVALVIGSGSGYSSAVLSRMAQTVVALESDDDLIPRSGAMLGELALDNVAVMKGDLLSGCPEQGPYNVILIDGAVEFVPDLVLNQLADGGRLACVIDESGQGVGSVYTRQGSSFGHRPLFDANIPLLPGFTRPPEFVF